MLERLTGSGVVALWGVFNAILMFVLVGFVLAGIGDSPFVLDVYGSSVGLVFAIAVAVWLGRRRRQWLRGWRQPAGTASVILFTIAAFLVWLGLAFGVWVTILAAFPLVLTILLEYAIRRRTA